MTTEAKKYVVDTNVVLNNISALIPEEVVVTTMLLREIEKHKSSRSSDLAYRARVAQTWLKVNEERLTYDTKPYRLKMLLEHGDYDEQYIDNQFLECLLQNPEYGLITEDMLLGIQAHGFGREVKQLQQVTTDVYSYKGYIKLNPNDDTHAELIDRVWNDDKSVAEEVELVVNQYVIIDDPSQQKFKDMVKRWNGETFVDIKLPDYRVVKPRNAEQACALDALNNPDITAVFVLGLAGSGKTMMSVKMAQEKMMNKGDYGRIALMRKADVSSVGYLPGDLDEKMDVFFQTFMQHLENPLQDPVHMVENGQLTKHEISFVKGLSMDSTLILVDECSDLSLKEIRNCGTRVGKDSKIVFTGDFAQTNDAFVKSSGIIEAVNKLKGDPQCAIVVLTQDERSETCKLFANNL